MRFDGLDNSLGAALDQSPSGLWDVRFLSRDGIPYPYYAVLPGECRADAWLLGEALQNALVQRQAELHEGQEHIISGLEAVPHEEDT